MSGVLIDVAGVAKSFTLHAQGTRLAVLDGVSLTVREGGCVALTGPSGSGKSTLLRAIYANYSVDAGRIGVRDGDRWIDMASARPRDVLAIRRYGIGYVSQFLRVVPRVAAVDVVAEPLRARGLTAEEARARASALLMRLNITGRLMMLPPATFSGGEQQRVNIARGIVAEPPVLLLDEPTASLDRENRAIVIDLIHEAKNRGAAIVGIFHDREVREAVADQEFDLSAARHAA